MKIFEPHIHMYARTTDCYEALALAGVRALVEPAFWLGQPRTTVGAFVDYFSAIAEFEHQRAAAVVIDQYHTISVNPREANDEALANEVLAAMGPFLDHERCVAVGEIGFDDITAAEERILQKQIDIGMERDLPLLIHAPHREKKQGTERCLAMFRESGIAPERVLYDHNTEETMDMVRESGCWAGLTVYPLTKLSPERAANILEQYGTDRIIVSSSADWGPSDPLRVAKTILELRRRGWQDDALEKVFWENPRDFYAQSGRLRAPTLEG